VGLDTVLQVVSQEPVPTTQLNALVPRDLEALALQMNVGGKTLLKLMDEYNYAKYTQGWI
jgi:hypothetical protein